MAEPIDALAPLIVAVRKQITSAVFWRAEWPILAAIASVLVGLGILIAGPTLPFTAGSGVGVIWYFAVWLSRQERKRLWLCCELLDFIDTNIRGGGHIDERRNDFLA